MYWLCYVWGNQNQKEMRNFVFDEDYNNPTWLKSAVVTICDENEVMCFDTRYGEGENEKGLLSLEQVTCKQDYGIVNGSELLLNGKSYVVKHIQLYTGLFGSVDQRTNGIHLQIMIIVEGRFSDNPFPI